MSKSDDGRVALDSSVIVALLCDWHAAHDAARRAVDRERRLRRRLLLPSWSLIESYSVLTRLPAPRRLAPSMAVELLRLNLASAKLETLGRGDFWPLIESSASQAVAGGAVYDRLISTTALLHEASAVLTLNPRHYSGIEGLTVLVPGLEI